MLTQYLFKTLGLTVLCAGTLAISAPVQALNYTIGWTGSGGYTLAGSFSFNDNLANTGAITFGALNSFSFTNFLNGVPLGTNTTAANFNFNTTTQQFLVGGLSTSTSGQAWGDLTAGFSSGNTSQSLRVNSVQVGAIPVNTSTLTAILIPFEFSPELGLTVLAGLWLARQSLKPKLQT